MANERIQNLLSRVDAALTQNRRWIWGLFVGSFLLKLVYVLRSAGATHVTVPIMDSEYYVHMAEDLLSGRLVRNDAFFMGPLYPYALAVILGTFGKSIMAVRIVQMAVGSLTVVMTYLVGRELMRPSIALLGAVLLALYGAVTFYEGQLLMMWLGTFLNVSMLFVLVRSTGAAACISSGVLLGLSALARANVLVMVFVVVPWILMSGSRRRWRHAGYFLAALIVTILPATVHNFVASRDFVPITSNGGVNFYIGNSEDATGIFYPPRGINLVTDDAVHTYVERVLGRKVSPSEASDYWFDEAATYIRSHPADWVVLMGRKTAMFFNGYEIPQIESFAIARERYAILRVMFVNAWMLIALGVTGMLFAVGRWRKFFLLYGYVFAFALSIILFFITSRYRVQIAPALALFAAWAVVVALPDAITSLKRRIWPLALIALLVLATNPSIFALPEDEVRWREHTHESRRLSKIGKYDEAVAEANAAIEVHPDYADSYINRALIEKDAGKRFEAVEDYARAVEINPNLSTVQYDFGQLLRSLKMNGPAIEAYRRAVELNPLMLEAYNNLGITYQLEGRYEEAITQFERVIALDPQYIKAYNNLGASLAQSGQLDRAIDVLTRGIEMDPDYSGTYRNLAMIYVQKKDVPRAYEEMTRYVELEPEDRQAVEVLAQLRMVIEGDTLGVTPAPGSEESQQ